MNDFWYPHVTVATVVEQAGRFLLVRELAGGQEVYNQPAGHLDPNETLVQAAVRETLEETGWEVQVTGVLGLSVYQADNGTTYQRNTFVARAVKQYPEAPLDEGILAAEWLSLAEMQQRAEMMRSPMVIASVERYLSGHYYPLDVLFQVPAGAY